MIACSFWAISSSEARLADEASYSKPTIEIKSPQGAQTGSVYLLKFTASGADTVKVDGQLLTASGGLYSKSLEMKQPSISIYIEALNKYHSDSQRINVSRPKSSVEIQAEAERITKEKAETARLENERKKAEQQRQALAQKEEKLKTMLTQKYERIVKAGGYIYEIENKLADLDFYQTDSGLAKAPDGSTQAYMIYKKEDQ